jgi:Ca2+-binding RTX toxin-like protein
VSDGVRTAEAIVVVGVTAPPQESLTGGNGTDIINGGNGADYINGGNGIDILFGGNGADVVFGGGGVDLLFGENGNDSLYGQAGNDILFGDNGGDFLAGGTGDDLLTGGNGADTFLFRQGDGSDIVLDFRKNQGDRIQIDMQGIDNFDDLLAVAQQQNGGVLFAFETGDELFLVGTQLAALDRNNFTFY